MEKITKEIEKNFNTAQKFTKEGKFKESIYLLKKIILEIPNLVPVLNNIGFAYEKLSNLKEAIFYYEKCYNKHPEKLNFINTLGKVYFKDNNFKKSEFFFNKSLSIDKNQIRIIELKSESLIRLDLRKKLKLFLEDKNEESYKKVEKSLCAPTWKVFLGLHKSCFKLFKKSKWNYISSHENVKIN